MGAGYRFGPALLEAGSAHGLRSVAPDLNVGSGNVPSQAAYYHRGFRLSLTYYAFGARN